MTDFFTTPALKAAAKRMDDAREFGSNALVHVLHGAHLRGETITDADALDRAATYCRAEAAKRRGYNGPKAQRDAEMYDALANAVQTK